MVKTRHSGGTDAESSPTFISLANEKSRQSLKNDDSGQPERSYGERGDAYNIFDEKVVESRLRPRIGPSRAYNYIDVDSSDEEIIRRRHRHLPIQEYSPEHRRARYSSSRQIKQEMLEKQERPRQVMHRQSSPNEDTEEQSTEEEEEDRRHRITRRQRSSDGVDEIEGDEKSRSSSSRRLQLSLEEHENARKSLRTRPQSVEDEENPRAHNLRRRPTTEEDEEHLIRRSSRTRRQVYDTLNQSYLVSIPGRSRNDSGDNNEHSDGKDHDSDDNQEFSDMYSRVKRKRVRVKRNMYGVPVTDESDSEPDEDIAKGNKSNNNKGDDDDDDDDGNDDDEEENGEDETGENMKDVGNTSRRVTRQKNHSVHKKQPEIVKSYSLREHKPRTDLYKAPIEERRIKRIHGSIFGGTQTKKIVNQAYCSPAQRRNVRKRSAFHSSSSSTSSGSESSDEKSFNRRKAKSMDKARSRMLPLNFNSNALPIPSIIKDRLKAGSGLADIEAMSIDQNVTFNSIGGLGSHIRALKEMIVFPLLYGEVFERYQSDPPRGVLFYGPPGTGKTLVARALANECSQGNKRVAFFMRKGADCLSKWVGESERQLRLLFDQAYKFRPSIIFFDEIDGLAPVRSSRQDQIHSSIVSTLLALMDGLDSRGEIVVIGATNRIDSLDPALRRPGRFDREFIFQLPTLEARKQILKIHTAGWSPRLNDDFIAELAQKCSGYCGADLKSLCTETTIRALGRRYPQIYFSNEALQLDPYSVNVSARDFLHAVTKIIPTSKRAASTPSRALPPHVSPLLKRLLDKVMSQLNEIFPPCLAQSSPLETAATSSQAQDMAASAILWDDLASDDEVDAPSIYEHPTSNKGKSNRLSVDQRPSVSRAPPLYFNFASSATSYPTTFRPRLILTGRERQGQTTYIAPAIIHRLENLPVHVLDVQIIHGVTAKTPEESCANVFHEAKRKCPSIIYMPFIHRTWDVMGDTVKAVLLTLIQDIDPSLPLLLLATSEMPYHSLDPVLQSLFSQVSGEVVHMTDPNMEERRAFFKDLLLVQAIQPPRQKKQAGAILELLKTKSVIKKTLERSCKNIQKECAPLYSNRCQFEDCEMDEPLSEDMSDCEIHQDIPINIVSVTHSRRKELPGFVGCHPYSPLRKNIRTLHANTEPKAKKRRHYDTRSKAKEPSQVTVNHRIPIARTSSKSVCRRTLRSQSNNDKLNRNHSARPSECQCTPVFHKSKHPTISQKDSYKKPRMILALVHRTSVNALYKRTINNKTSPRLYYGKHQMLYKRTWGFRNQNCMRAKPWNLPDFHSELCTCHKGIRQRILEKSLLSPKDRREIPCSHCYLRCRQLWRQTSDGIAQRMLEVLPKAAPPKPKELTEEELSSLVDKEELTLMELRIFLRDVLNKLGSDKKFSIFAKPVNIEDAADYYDIIEHPMDLSTMMAKIDLHEYTTVRSFMQDIDLICCNALEYNPNRGTMDRIIRHRACALKDTAYAIIKTDLDKDFEKTCIEIEESRKRRGDKSTTVPNFYYTKPGNQRNGSKSQSITPSYLDQPKLTRSIPKPEGERFSRRVRGMNIDPVPPLESVEKVYKISRVDSLPSQDDKSGQNDEPESHLQNSSISEKHRTASMNNNCSWSQLPTDAPLLKKAKVADNKTSVEKKTVQSSTSSLSAKRKKNKCVWCKPRRKRSKFYISKSSSANHASGDEAAEDEMSHEEFDDGKVAQESQNDSSRQLVVDTTEMEVSAESKEIRSPVRISTRSRSPAHVSPVSNCTSRVSTRRSSLSPNPVPVNHQSSSNQSQVNTDQSESNKDGEPFIQERSRGESADKPHADSIDSSCHQPKPLGQLQSLIMEPPYRPKVVKRLDLEPVTVDSGVGSSVDSNGDSRDSMDHKVEGEPGVRVSVFSGAEGDCNQNSNKELNTKACAVLNEPTPKLVVDNNRLTSLLTRLVARTDGYTVDCLEEIYSHLSRIIFRHRDEYDKSAMVSDLAQKVDELTKIGLSKSMTSATNSSTTPTISSATPTNSTTDSAA